MTTTETVMYLFSRQPDDSGWVIEYGDHGAGLSTDEEVRKVMQAVRRYASDGVRFKLQKFRVTRELLSEVAL